MMAQEGHTPKQKNKRLSQHDRDALVRFARKRVEESEDSTELDEAYNRAAAAPARAAMPAANPFAGGAL